MIEVVAALVKRDGRFMICQRSENKSRPLLWEFPGGKVEAGETKEAALARECREELAIELEVGKMFADSTFVYPDISVHLSLFEAKIVSGEPKLLEHKDIRWITPEEAHLFEFSPADVPFVEKLCYNAPVFLDGE
ncbi:(deoxy)nucleoside triphosphate pyrophosphohydrolase [bacterium]|nr:(deoxy)nucleoside triphosphate pyrophosphohydrolase [bacterium]